MPEAFFRPRPFGLPNLSPDGVGESSGEQWRRTFGKYLHIIKERVHGGVEMYEKSGWRQKYGNTYFTRAGFVQGSLYYIPGLAERDVKPEAQNIGERLHIGYLAHAYLYLSPQERRTAGHVFNEFRIRAEQIGKSFTEVTLEPEETDLLIWALNEAEVPHNVQSGRTTIPLEKLERRVRSFDYDRDMSIAALDLQLGTNTYTRDPEQETPQEPDHETRTRRDIAALMSEWKQSEKGNS